MLKRRLTFLPTIVAAIALFALGLGVYRALLLGVADWRFRSADLRGISGAERILPSNAAYHYARALALQQEDPASPEVDRELAQAIALNPRFSDAMLSWSVDKEFSGDKHGAETLLLNARDVDRELRPTWALANFYYRQGDAARFWPEARECLRLIAVASYTTGRYNPTPIFQLCWSMQPDAAAILTKAIPHDPQLEQIYLSYLLAKRNIDAQVGLVARILPRSSSGDLWILMPHIDTLVGAGQIATAVHEWNELVSRKILPYQPLDPAQGTSLTDGSFLSAPSGAGFDWRTLYPESVRFTFSDTEHAYRFEFDGSEPAKFDLLSEIAPLLPGRTYRLSSKYRADFDTWASGMSWVLNVNGNPLPARVVSVSGGNEKTIVVEFQTPSQTNAATLLLTYSRNPGTTLIRGAFDLLKTSLTLQ